MGQAEGSIDEALGDMPRLPGHKTFQLGVAWPVEQDRCLGVDSERLEVPTFDNVEHLVAAMARKGLLERDPVVARAREAARLLQSGLAPSHVAAELAFSDQSHMTHSLKRFLGQTPAQLARQEALEQ